MKSSLLNTNSGVVFAPCCCDSGAKFSGVPNCGKYRKVLEGAITEVIIHRKCTNSTSPLFSETFWKHFSQIEHFSTNFSFVIYATNKHVLFTLSSKSLQFRKKIAFEKGGLFNSTFPDWKKENKMRAEIDESSKLLLFMGCFPHACIPFRAQAWSHKAEKAEKFECIQAESVNVAANLNSKS